MKRYKAVLLGLIAVTVLTASAMAQVPIRRGPPTAAPPVARKGRTEPCWQVAGIPPSVMQQKRMIVRQTRQEIAAVCANSSLSPAQKQEEIRQIRQREHQELDGLATPEQREAFRACQAQRGHVSHAHVGGRGRGLGPCGVISGVPRHPLVEDEDEDEGSGVEGVPNKGRHPVAAPDKN